LGPSDRSVGPKMDQRCRLAAATGAGSLPVTATGTPAGASRRPDDSSGYQWSARECQVLDRRVRVGGCLVLGRLRQCATARRCLPTRNLGLPA
jgi:hypothetical protein